MPRTPHGKRKPENITVGVNVRTLRENGRYSREEFAELIDASSRIIYDYEVGASGMSIPKLKKTCEVLGVSSDRILWGEDTGAIPLEERMMHLDEETQRLLHKMLTTQLEIIELAKKMGRAEAEAEAGLKEKKPKKTKKK